MITIKLVILEEAVSVNPTSIQRSVAASAARQLAWPPSVSQPLFRADPEVVSPRRRAAADLQLALRLTAITVLIAAGIGLGHGVSASADSSSGPSSAEPSSSANSVATVNAIQSAVSNR
jgi:hypothetical protein